MADETDHPADPFPKSAREQLIAPDYVGAGARKILDALQNAKPRILEQPGGLNPTRVVAASAAPILEAGRGSVVRRIRADEFSSPDAAEQNAITESFVPNISFFLKDATTTEGDPPEESNKVLVLDGKLDNQYPSGMGAGNYIIDLETPEDAIIYVGATFNPQSLALTSSFLGVSAAADFPESRVESVNEGFLYWQLGFTYFDPDGNFTIWNSRLGDIYLELIYGSQNGQPALWAGAQIGWLDLTFA